MAHVFFGLENDPTAWFLSSVSPWKTISASEIDEVIPLVQAADNAAHEGNYVALMLSYEAAPAFDSAFKTREQTSLPLAWAAIIPQPDDVECLSDSENFVAEWTPQVSREDYDNAIA